MRLLLTGAAGFLGSWLAPELEGAGYDVIRIDYADGDLEEATVAQHLVAAARPDVVVHLAAQPGRLFCEDDHEAALRANVLMTVNVADAARRAGARLVHFSTSEVYGDHRDVLCEETMPLAGTPSGMYALTKRWSEDAAHAYGPPGVQVIRPTMPYGPGVRPGYGRRALDNFLWAALHGERITVHRGAGRSWCWVGDVARGLRMVIESGEPGAWNVGRDDDDRTMLEVAEIACDLTGARRSLIEVVEPPPHQTVVKRLSTAKLRGLGWAPEVELRDGMGRVLDWLRGLEAEAA